MNKEISKIRTMNSKVASEIPCNIFYGSQPRSTASPSKKYIIPASVLEFGLLGPPMTWKVFPKQQPMLEYVSGKDLTPFTFQDDRGNRRFLAAHPELFWHYDRQRPDKDRRSYEIIREGTFCKLYFDLEFPKGDGFQGEECEGIMEDFQLLLMLALKNVYEMEGAFILRMDSSTGAKFSKHLILPGCVFKDNSSAGAFVKEFCRQIRRLKDGKVSSMLKGAGDMSKERIGRLFHRQEEGGEEILFVDECVYTKNRHFRLYRSSKFEKNSPLVKDCDFEGDERDFFLESLVTYLPKKAEKFLEFVSSSSSADKSRRYEGIKGRSSIVKMESHLVHDSPYEEIDAFVNKLIAPGRVWRANFFEKTSTLVYDIVGNRYCDNIGRWHKSNNVMIVVNLADYTFYQKCHDVRCGGFKSQPRRLPQDVISGLVEREFDPAMVEAAECLLMFEEDPNIFRE